MPLRSRLRRAFTRGAHDDPQLVKGKKTKNFDPNVYQPGEKMPPLKYRRPVAPEHKAHLESFEWAKAWRRKSAQSIYSPMGSRMVSRKSSFQSFRTRRSVRSVHRRSGSKHRGEEYRENDSGIGASLDGEENIREHSDEENDVLNVGLSRNPTEDPKRPRKSSSLRRPSSSSLPPTHNLSSHNNPSSLPPSSHPDHPFDPSELEAALQKTTLDSTKEVDTPVEGSGETSPLHQVERPFGGEKPFGDVYGPEPPLRPRERLIAFEEGVRGGDGRRVGSF